MRRIVSGPFAGLLIASLALLGSPAIATAAAPSSPAPALTASAGVGYTLSAVVAPAEPAEDDGDDDVVIIEDDEMEGGPTEPAAGGDEAPAGPADDGGEIDIFGDDDDGGSEEGLKALDPEAEEALIKNEMGLITVKQRQRMLKKGRFELAPQFGLTVNDPYVRHYAIGLDMNYWLRNRIALGLTGTGFIAVRTPRYTAIRFQEGLLLSANKTLWQASLNFSYIPFYGKIAIFNRALLHWEVATHIGGGATQTQVIPRYEALHDPFNTFTGGGVVGAVARTYLPKLNWLSYQVGVRVWVYPDKLEPIRRGPDTTAGVGRDDPLLDDPDAAKKASDFRLAFNVTVYAGVSFFFPTSFKYLLPR